MIISSLVELPKGSPKGSYFDAAAAQQALDFCSTHLKHFEGDLAGQPVNPVGWTHDALVRIFGLKKEDGRRLIRKAFVFVPRGNWKTSWAATIGLKTLAADGGRGRVIVTAAKDRDQAALIYRYCAMYVRNDPELSGIVECIDSQKRLVVPATGSYLVSVPADHKGLFGVHAEVILLDEMHVVDPELVTTLVTSQGTVSEPLVIFTTTAGEDPIHSIAGIEYQYAKKVRDGVVVDPSYLPIIYEADAKDDPFAEETLRKANPVWDHAGETFRSYLIAQRERAKEQPSFLPVFKTYHLNLWGAPSARWADMPKWDACAGPIDLEALKPLSAYGGLDLSATQDMTAFVMVFRAPDGTLIVLPHLYVPADSISKRSRLDRVPYDLWSQQNTPCGIHADCRLVTATPGNIVDQSWIERDILLAQKTYRLESIGFDSWNATGIVSRLMAEGVRLEEFRQGFSSMSEPTKELERRYLSGTLRHSGHDALRWCISNAVAEIDAAENVKLSKAKSHDRIDGATALVMAIGRAMRGANAPEPRISFITW